MAKNKMSKDNNNNNNVQASEEIKKDLKLFRLERKICVMNKIIFLILDEF